MRNYSELIMILVEMSRDKLYLFKIMLTKDEIMTPLKMFVGGF